MKLKARIKSFWRHNKWCPGMYAVLIQVVTICICIGIGNLHGCISSLMFAAVFSIVWMHERHIIMQRRCHEINRHRVTIMLCMAYENYQEKEAELKKDIEAIALKYDAVKKENEKLKEQLNHD